MATTTTDLGDALVKAGVDQDAAIEIQHRLERRGGPSAMSMLVGATVAGFALLAVGLGWLKSDVAGVRAELRGEITTNRTQINAVSERLTRIATLLEERLPERQ